MSTTDTLRFSQRFACIADGRTLGDHRDAVSSAFGPDVQMHTVRADDDGRSVEPILYEDGSMDIVVHRIARVSNRGRAPTTYRDTVRVDYHGGATITAEGRVMTRDSLTVWTRKPSARLDS